MPALVAFVVLGCERRPTPVGSASSRAAGGDASGSGLASGPPTSTGPLPVASTARLERARAACVKQEPNPSLVKRHEERGGGWTAKYFGDAENADPDEVYSAALAKAHHPSAELSTITFRGRLHADGTFRSDSAGNSDPRAARPTSLYFTFKIEYHDPTRAPGGDFVLHELDLVFVRAAFRDGVSFGTNHGLPPPCCPIRKAFAAASASGIPADAVVEVHIPPTRRRTSADGASPWTGTRNTRGGSTT